MRTPPALKCSVENLRNKNQHLIYTSIGGCDWIVFQSYKSECAMYNKTKRQVWLNIDCWLSKTTSKHLYIFLSNYTHLSVHNINELKEMIEEGEIIKYSRKKPSKARVEKDK